MESVEREDLAAGSQSISIPVGAFTTARRIGTAAVASYSALPEPMLASGRLPASGDYAFEVKCDGFRAIVSTEGTLRARSPRRLPTRPTSG